MPKHPYLSEKKPMNSLIGPVSLRLRLLGLIAGVVLVWLILLLVRKQKIKPGYSLIWLGLGVGLILVSVFTNLLRWSAIILGVFYEPVGLLLLVIFAMILLLIHFSLVMSSQDVKINLLIQELALVKQKLNELKVKRRRP